jgi:hypothetical protein
MNEYQHMSKEIYNLYKPFRNKISKYYLLDECLYLVWAYSRNLLFDYPFPNDIEILPTYNPSDIVNIRRAKGIPEFFLEFLAKEFIINCNNYTTTKSILKKEEFMKVGKYVSNEMYITIENISITKNDALLEFYRKAHSQIKGQKSFNRDTILRYYSIYSSEKLNAIILNKLGLNAYQFFSIAFLFFTWTAKNFKTKLPISSDIPNLPTELIEKFLNHFSIKIDDAKINLKSYQEINENLFYTYNPLYSTPILIVDDYFLCPTPLSIYWLLQDGLYHNIVNESGFSDAFGPAFEKHIGYILAKCCTNNFSIYSETNYGNSTSRTTDWIIEDKESVLFLECKTKRPTLNTKTKLDPESEKGIIYDLRKLSVEIRKLYTTFLDFTKGKYSNIQYDSTKNIFLSVITLEDWYFELNPKMEEMLMELVHQSFNEKNMDVQLIEQYPYRIFSAEVFEREIQIINSIGINNYFHLINNNQLNDLNEIRNTIEYTDVFNPSCYDIFDIPTV